jgi:hypothetical protein
VELLLDLAPLLTAGLELAHFLKEVSEVWTALELQRELQLLRVAHALKQEADSAGAGMSEELAGKRRDSARETIAVVGGGDGEDPISPHLIVTGHGFADQKRRKSEDGLTKPSKTKRNKAKP